MNPPSHPTPGPPRLRRAAAALAALALTALLTLAAGTVPAAAGPRSDEGQPTRADVYRALGLDRLPADYVILVDVSGSMLEKGRYASVRSALLPFLKGLSPDDYVALFTFGDKAEAVHLGSAADPAGIVAKLPAAPAGPGVMTDIGAGLDRALTELERPEAAEIGSVVMFTDGKHEPPGGSDYPRDTGPAWDKLARRGAALDQSRELAAYSLPLATKESGTKQLAGVIPETSELKPESVEDLGTYLGRAAERVKARKAALLVAEDKGKGVTAAWSPSATLDLDRGSAAGTLTLTARTERVPLTVSGLRMTLDGEPVTVTGLPPEVTLEPGEARKFPVRVTGDLDAGWLPVRRTREVTARPTVHGTVRSAWESALDDVTFDLPRSVSSPADGVRLRGEVGSALTLPLVTGVPLAAALAWWLLWRSRNRAVLAGILVLSHALGDGPQDRITLRGRQMRLADLRLGGAGSVRGSRLRGPNGEKGVQLHIGYSPDGSAERRTEAVCPPHGEVMINGVTFTHLRDDTPAPAAPPGHPAPMPAPIPRPTPAPPPAPPQEGEFGPWQGPTMGAGDRLRNPYEGMPPEDNPYRAPGPWHDPAEPERP
ncbi:hypothetical protein SRB5_51110 [Streptomyces sp. RB5]|uniref:VWFA domain-containing protein n=1 Tax=Streptomyces smaragdinus TaxID=2585196 RepID=A0A7K0CN77_9ACTN|nr:vWA domain-containing protein [Streptomyces smaragdinus]MQY14935.1 hypothetical protein [Streptomyces smaragdinus]